MSENDGNSWSDLWDGPCGVSDWVSGVGTGGLVVPFVTDVAVSPSSVVTEVCDGFSLGSDGDPLEPQSFSFSKKCAQQERLRFPMRNRSNSRWRARFGVRVTERLLQKRCTTWKEAIF